MIKVQLVGFVNNFHCKRGNIEYQKWNYLNEADNESILNDCACVIVSIGYQNKANIESVLLDYYKKSGWAIPVLVFDAYKDDIFGDLRWANFKGQPCVYLHYISNDYDDIYAAFEEYVMKYEKDRQAWLRDTYSGQEQSIQDLEAEIFLANENIKDKQNKIFELQVMLSILNGENGGLKHRLMELETLIGNNHTSALGEGIIDNNHTNALGEGIIDNNHTNALREELIKAYQTINDIETILKQKHKSSL